MTNPIEPRLSRRPRRGRALIGSLLALLFLAGLFVLVRPSGDEDEGGLRTETTPPIESEPEVTTPAAPATTTATTAATGPTRVRIDVSGGRPTGGITRVGFRKNERVLLVVRADAPEVVHLHGYDREAPVAPNAPARIGFKADQPGRFELELEQSGVLIAEISVEP